MGAMEDRRRVLIVDDEAGIREMVAGFFETKGYSARTAASGEEALELLGTANGPKDTNRTPESHDSPNSQLAWRPHAVVLDLRLPGISGLDTLARIKTLDRRIPVVLVTGHGTVDAAVAAMKLGAEDFVAKPVRLAELLKTVERVATECAQAGLEGPSLEHGASLRDLMGPSAAIEKVCQLVNQVADTNLTVILYGETGAGKSLVARAIHNLSERGRPRPGGLPSGRFVRVDCGAIPDTLIESELFGHERGAFTGAVQRNQGYFELAHQGTLFLDEIANLSEAMMRKLLCALEDRRIYRVGGKEPIDVDIRVVAASNQNLHGLVEKGAFRRDLFHRLAEFAIEIPPLRKRKEDIAFLAQRFLAAANAELGRNVRAISPPAMQALYDYDWPGNVRELRNVIKRATLLCKDAIEPEHVRAASAVHCGLAIADLRFQSAIGNQQSPIAPALQGQLSLKEITRECVRQVEQAVIAAVLKETGGNRSRAARILNVDYKTLYYKAKELGE